MPKDKEPKKDFEEKLKQDQAEEIPGSEKKESLFSKFKKKKKHRRTTEEIIQDRIAGAIAVDPEQIELFKPVIKLPFDVWADNIKVRQLRLNDSEAERLALPIVQLVNYYLPRLSPIGYVWLSFSVTTFGIVSVRLKLLADLRREKEEIPRGNVGDEKQGKS